MSIQIGPLQLASRDHTFPRNVFLSMGYNLMNARNGKSASKIAIMAKLKELKGKLIRQFEFSENLEDLYGKCCWRARPCSPTTFSIQILFFKKFRLPLILIQILPFEHFRCALSISGILVFIAYNIKLF